MSSTKPKPLLKSHRVSVSLYPSDQARILAIQRGLLDEGVLVSDSEAIRLALQTVSFNPREFLKTRNSLDNDLRRKR